MRQIWVSVPEGEGNRVQELAKQHQGLNLIMFRAEDQEQPRDVVIFNIANRAVGDVLEALEGFSQIHVTLHPQDVFPLPQLKEKVPDQITRVTQRSPMEVWLNGLQSIGSWKGFLGYAIAASIIVWVGLYTNTTFLLVSAMLVAPFAGPAMNFALATASGDGYLLRRNLLRYFLSLLLTVLVTALLSFIFQQRTSTSMMVQISEVSFIVFLLPLTAGAVGAHSLSQSANSSLVPGTAVGVLVAASLAPPAGVIGMSLAIGRWDMAMNGSFLLILQLCAINLSGALIFHLYGQKPGNVILHDSEPKYRWISLLSSVLILTAMLLWQFSSSPAFQRSSRAQRASSIAEQVIREDPRVDLVKVHMEFPRPSIVRQNTLLGTIYVERKPATEQSAEQIEQDLVQEIQRRLLQSGFQVKPLISVTLLDPPTRDENP